MSEFRVDQITNQSGSRGPDIAGITTFSATSGMVMPVDRSSQGILGGISKENLFLYHDPGLSLSSGLLTDLSGNNLHMQIVGPTLTLDGTDNQTSYLTFDGSDDYARLTTDQNPQALSSFPRSGSMTLGMTLKINTFTHVRPFVNRWSGVDQFRVYMFYDSQGEALPITPGAIRFNTDSMKLEYYRGGPVGFGTTTTTGEWVNITTDSPDIQTGGTRGVFAIGSTGSPTLSYDTTTQYITVSTTGNAIDFGDLTGTARGYGASFSSRTRGVFAAGQNGGVNQNNIDYVTISSTGTATAFGNISDVLVRYPTGLSNATRGILVGGYDGSNVRNEMRYVTIAATGSTVDFGNLITASYGGSTCSSSTRGIIANGHGSPARVNSIEFITISTLGNGADFGDNTATTNGMYGCSNSVRGIFAGGYSPSYVNTITYVSIPTLGDAIDFGDLTRSNGYGTSAASSTRGTFIAGTVWPEATNTIDYVQIMSTGNAIDFGDLIDSKTGGGAFGCSNGHGGLG
jgi:hypothetical protein